MTGQTILLQDGQNFLVKRNCINALNRIDGNRWTGAGDFDDEYKGTQQNIDGSCLH